jgi:N-acetylmuramic acid 6-phosphate (MurNAc-6-P) etherase
VDALKLLTHAEGKVKVALVMARRGLSRDEAQGLLDRHAGQLRPILGPPK